MTLCDLHCRCVGNHSSTCFISVCMLLGIPQTCHFTAKSATRRSGPRPVYANTSGPTAESSRSFVPSARRCSAAATICTHTCVPSMAAAVRARPGPPVRNTTASCAGRNSARSPVFSRTFRHTPISWHSKMSAILQLIRPRALVQS